MRLILVPNFSKLSYIMKLMRASWSKIRDIFVL
jgi:hypothetical protein